MKLKSFGCSFVYGSDLSDERATRRASQLTWPALIANALGLEHQCHAWPGIGNLKILCEVMKQAAASDPAVFVINWTWIDRFDFIDPEEKWQALRPGDQSDLADLYYRRLHSQFRDMVTSVYHINSAIDMLCQRNVPFLMTYMDYNLLETVQPSWQDPGYIQASQQRIKHYLSHFDGKNFLDWSKDQGFEISSTWHPLESAHAAAANFMMPTIDAILHRA